MDTKTRKLIENYVSDNVDSFHQNRIAKLHKLRLPQVLRSKNPYLFRVKNMNRAPDFVTAILDARLSSSEEGSFGGFLEALAIHVASVTGGGTKAATTGIDIELTRNKVRYLIAVKSGKNWGNSGQHRELKARFRTAVKVLRQNKQMGEVQPTLGICYGNFETLNNGEFLHIGGQSFWHLLSGDAELYIDLIEPLGSDAEKHNKVFSDERDRTYNRLIHEFMNAYCLKSGAIDWPKVMKFVSGNLPEQAPFA